MRRRAYPIIEFDPVREAKIEPSKLIRPTGIPERCLLTFFREVVDKLVESGRAKPVSRIDTEMGPLSIHELAHEGQRMTVVQPGVTAPLAAAVMEELIAQGGRTFVACGSAGVLRKELLRGMVVVVSSALRDEGTSYHYLAPAREVTADPALVKLTRGVLKKRGVRHRAGKTWTTDGIYRETRDRVRSRQREGCLTVEMEAAAFMAVARFRQVKFVQLLAAGDDVSGKEWDPRHSGERASHREKLFWLAAEVCLAL